MKKLIPLLIILTITISITGCQKTETAASPEETTAAVVESVNPAEPTLALAEIPTLAETSAPADTPASAEPETLTAATTETFSPAEIHDLISVDLQAECGDFTVTDAESLKWFEEHFSKAQELDGWPECPYDAMLTFNRADGKSFKVEAASDSCTNFLLGVVWYSYETESGNNTDMYEHFGVTTAMGGVKKVAD